MDDSASKSLRLSAMLMDSSISGSFFCRDRVRRYKLPPAVHVDEEDRLFVYHSLLCLQPRLALHAALQLLVYQLSRLLGWFNPLLHLQSATEHVLSASVLWQPQSRQVQSNMMLD